MAAELETLRYEVEALRRRMQASIERRDMSETLLIGVCKTMIAERELRIRELEHTPEDEPPHRHAHV